MSRGMNTKLRAWPLRISLEKDQAMIFSFLVVQTDVKLKLIQSLYAHKQRLGVVKIMNFPFIKAIILLPGNVLVFIPLTILWLSRDDVSLVRIIPSSMLALAFGLLFLAVGLFLVIWTMRIFIKQGGGGTPAPWDPIKNFVVEGPYLYVRNPMIIGVILLLISESIILQSWEIFSWMIVFVIINSAYFVLFEEPNLERRFGEEYLSYKLNVPRWLPRISAYQKAQT